MIINIIIIVVVIFVARSFITLSGLQVMDLELFQSSRTWYLVNSIY